MARAKVQAGGVLRTSLDNTWRTPPEVLERVRAYFGGPIPLDPATGEDNPTGALRFCARPAPKAERGPSLFSDPAHAPGGALVGPNGLEIEWDVPTWVNPPYGEELREWLDKIVAEGARGAEVLALLPCSRWETEYFPRLLNAANAVCFHRGRIAFISSIDGQPVSGNPYASMFLGFNVDLGRFRQAFEPLGACYALRALGETPETFLRLQKLQAFVEHVSEQPCELLPHYGKTCDELTDADPCVPCEAAALFEEASR